MIICFDGIIIYLKNQDIFFKSPKARIKNMFWKQIISNRHKQLETQTTTCPKDRLFHLAGHTVQFTN